MTLLKCFLLLHKFCRNAESLGRTLNWALSFQTDAPQSLLWATRWQFHAQQRQQREEEKLDKWIQADTWGGAHSGGAINAMQTFLQSASRAAQIQICHIKTPDQVQNVWGGFFLRVNLHRWSRSLLSRCLFSAFCYLYLCRTEWSYGCMTVWSFLEQSTL